MDGAVVVAPLPGVALAAEEDANEPALPATADDLSETTRQRSSETGTPVAHCWPADYSRFNYLGEERGEE